MPRPFLSLTAAVIIVLGAVAALDGVARSTAFAQARNPLTGERPAVRPAIPWRNTGWLNTPDGKPLTLTELRGRVVLLNFWTFTCWNCTGALPSLVEFDRRYRNQGLTIIGMHDPEFPPYGGEHDRNNVASALRKYHIEYPNAQDNDHATWDLYDIQYWPSFVLIDRKGEIRYEGYGEFHLGDVTHQEWDSRIRTLLAER
ncbi:MAG TPA: redoxin domain-containing protein [Gemmatimonadales bacterium]|nr:redoxin domain-containing protein [Gemmatimonadales bacterium]